MKLYFSLILFLCLYSNVQAQGKVTFIESDKIKSIFNNYIQKNKANTTIKGWRIQILSTTDRKEMESTRNRFTSSFPNVSNAWKHVSPYYQIRIGAYRTKEELQEFLYEVKKEFPASIAVQDDIEKIDLINF
jgi:hypothetical protein